MKINVHYILNQWEREKPVLFFHMMGNGRYGGPVWFTIPLFKSHINLKSYLTPFNECCVVWLCVCASATSLNAFSQAIQLLTFPIVIIKQNKRARRNERHRDEHRRQKSPHAGGLLRLCKHQRRINTTLRVSMLLLEVRKHKLATWLLFFFSLLHKKNPSLFWQGHVRSAQKYGSVKVTWVSGTPPQSGNEPAWLRVSEAHRGGDRHRGLCLSLLGWFQAGWRWRDVNRHISTARVTGQVQGRSLYGWAARGDVHVRLMGDHNTDLQWDGGGEWEGKGKDIQ